MESLEGFVLAGGASSRMGTDKAQLLINGQTFVERIATALAVVTNVVNVVGSLEKESESQLVNVKDVFEKWGALGGLHAALSACRATWALVVACDLPFVTGELFSRLTGLRHDFEAVAPVQNDGRPQPLCAIYRVDPCLLTAEKLIKSGERRPVSLLQSVRARWVAFDELADLDGAYRFFDNINTPEDYARVAKEQV
jgi:molybdopterin-guanine dinucleotide biosynthesis protein A